MADNRRLAKIASMIKKGMITADIGTDHAFLPIMLVRDGICEKVYACDVAEGPLQAARTNIAARGMQDCITAILTDGLQDVPQDTQCAVIAGMGFQTAKGILERAQSRLDDLKQIIVEVNRDTVSMRRWISDHGYTIVNETYVNDRGHDYVTIDFNTEKHEPYRIQDLVLGPVLKTEGKQEYAEFLKRRAEKIRQILSVSENGNPSLKEELSILDSFSVQ